MPFFSIILPVYNVEKYLARCVRSILAQDFPDYEIILVDDGSTDASPALCDALAAQHACMQVVHKANGGLSSARNAGLNAARGQYVWFIDPDDWIEPGALTLLHQAACAAGPDMLKFGYVRVENGRTPLLPDAAAGLHDGKEAVGALRREAFCRPGRFILSAWSHVYRRTFLMANGLTFVSEREIGSEDYLFNLQALLHAGKVHVLAQALYDYELRASSLTQTYKPDLPQRYARLTALMHAHYRDAGMVQEAPLIDRFCLWRLFFGTCFSHEYETITPAHTLQDGRRNVRAILRSDAVRHAIRHSDRTGLSCKRRILLTAMHWRAEPLLCWLFAGRNGRG